MKRILAEISYVAFPVIICVAVLVFIFWSTMLSGEFAK